MPSLTRPVAAVLAMLAIAVGTPVVCQGWMPTPEARMACCTGHDGDCPMHQSRSANAGATVIDQADADRCCAASDRDEPGTSPAAFALTTALDLVVSPVSAAAIDVTAAAQVWRTLVPIPPTHVPKHLLLSVLIV